MLDCLLDHKAQEHFFEVIYTPIFQLRIELLMRDSPPYTFFLLNDDMELNRNRQLLV
jgi:hypothetical protein